ncbi:MAG: hypothetical protein OQL09_05195, partial [Gammaproteobacteria bacterium]|nr:hypothetical protein [Gammaproteobacteria bacterium]
MKIFNSVVYLLFILLNISILGCDSKSLNVDNKATSQTVFAKNVVSILESRCLSCHGVKQDAYDQFMEGDNKEYFYFPITENNKIADIEITYRVSVGHGRVEYGEDARFSHLLRSPLAEEYGGIAHKGLDIFYATDDGDYQTMLSWLNTEIAEHPEQKKSLSGTAAYFKQEIQPVLVRNGCFLSSCHGPLSFTDLKLQPPLPDGRFSSEMSRENRQAVLGDLTRFVNLGGNLKRSRLLVKNIPIAQGGVHQRGGNNQFFEGYDDADVKILLQWMELEREALFKQLTIDGKPLGPEQRPGEDRGLVFIRGPRHMPRKYFAFDDFYPGSNIVYFDGEKETPLTEYKNAEIQSLDVSYDARKLVFAMRQSKDEGFRIYQLDLASKVVAPLSAAEARLADGTLVHHLDPIYSPGFRHDHDLSDVAISYASNIAGAYAAAEPWGILGEADNPQGASSTSVLVDRQRHEKAGRYEGYRISFVQGPNKGEWRTIVKHAPHQLTLDRPLPHGIDIQSIYVIESKQRHYAPAYDIWRFIPGEFEQSNARMTWGNSHERRPTVRSSGEVMATSVRNLGYQDDKPVFNGAIFRMQAGGFDFHPHGGERSQYALHTDAREMPEGLEIKTLQDPRNVWGGGQLALVDHGYGASTEA